VFANDVSPQKAAAYAMAHGGEHLHVKNVWDLKTEEPPPPVKTCPWPASAAASPPPAPAPFSAFGGWSRPWTRRAEPQP
jgi:hypothetical protein